MSKSEEAAFLETNQRKTRISASFAREAIPTVTEAQEERKHVTVLFSDLSGYTAMCDKLDPEEIKGIMSLIFQEIAEIVDNYDGFIEKYIGDAVMVLFGVPNAHEDDAIRAIKAALEIHEIIEGLSPSFENKIGQSLRMHTGIYTGLVVTGDVDVGKGTHGVSGDTINLAAMFENLAKEGEILVSAETYRQAEGYFTFQQVDDVKAKGKAEPVSAYKVLSAKERPVTVRRLSGLKADLIGRNIEMNQLAEKIQSLRTGKGAVVSICGDAGTGKSRLVEEFKATLNPHEIQWLEGHAYSYSQNIPYFPLVNMLNGAFQIEERDLPVAIKEKIESRIEKLPGVEKDAIPYIASLYNLHYPEIEDISPEYWKTRLQEKIYTIMGAIARTLPTIVFLEDLQWADPSSLELFRFLLVESNDPILFICAYRPTIKLLDRQKQERMKNQYLPINLHDLSPTDAKDMMESMLRTKTIPVALGQLIQEKAEGNPFYLEEMVNSLIESESLARVNGQWQLTKSFGSHNLPTTIHGVITARLDSLDKGSKRILQEASVIGKAFRYDILKRITGQKEYIDQYVKNLERLDLIRQKSLKPELEYSFKHALTHEVSYASLLRKERQMLHERITLEMERIFQNRLPEFYETLAFHAQKSNSLDNAVHYLVLSGDKSVSRYAVEEAHLHYETAFDLLLNKTSKTKKENKLLIDILLKWAIVFHYRGDFKKLTELLVPHQNLAKSPEDRARLEMMLGFSLGFGNEEYEKAHQYLANAVILGEKTKNLHIIGYASSWLGTILAEMGHLDEAIAFGRRALEISQHFPSDHYLYFNAMSGMGQAYWHRGDITNGTEIGNGMLEYGRRHSDIRCAVRGHYLVGWGHFINGDFPAAIDSFQQAIQISADPYHSQPPRLGLIYSYVSTEQFDKTHESLDELLSFTKKFGADLLETPAQALSGLVMIAEGQLRQGIKKFKKSQQVWQVKNRRCLYAASEYMIGRVYLQMVERKKGLPVSMLAKNILFLILNVPFAFKKSEKHFKKSARIAQEIGAKSTLGRACLDLGLIYKKKRKKDHSLKYLSQAIIAFESCGAERYLRQAKEALASMDSAEV